MTPAPGIAFEIPDEWWTFADMADFRPGSEFYPPDMSPYEKLALAEIQPPARSGIPLFKKYKLLPVLFAFQSPECCLPLVDVIELPEPGRYRYAVHNGLHRFYGSVAAGYTYIPARALPGANADDTVVARIVPERGLTEFHPSPSAGTLHAMSGSGERKAAPKSLDLTRARHSIPLGPCIGLHQHGSPTGSSILRETGRSSA